MEADGSRWRQWVGGPSRSFESDRQLEMDGTFFLTCTADSVRHRAACCTRHPFDPKRSKAMRRQDYWHGVHNPRLHSWNLQHDQSVNLISLISCDTVRHHQRAKTSYEACNMASLLMDVEMLRGSLQAQLSAPIGAIFAELLHCCCADSARRCD